MASPDGYEYQSDFARRYVAEGQQKTLLKLLSLKFGNLNDDAVKRIHNADADQLDRWIERILTAQSLTELFAED